MGLVSYMYKLAVDDKYQKLIISQNDMRIQHSSFTTLLGRTATVY